jgi:hypothetical protein
VWLPSLLASVFSVFLSLYSSRDVFFGVLNCFHYNSALIIDYVASNQIKVPQSKSEVYVAPMASFRNALNGPSLPP